MTEIGFWEDSQEIGAATAAAYYDYFARVFLTPIPVPGDECLADLRKRTGELFDLGSDDEAVALVAGFLDFDGGEAGDRQQELAVDRTYLFRGTDPSGLEPPYASFWAGQERSGLAYAVGAYRAGGFSPTDANHEREDYAGCELAFLACLAADEAQAAAEGDDRLAATLREQRREFACDHLAVWLPRYCERAANFAKTGFFKGMLRIMTYLFAGGER